ncbi:hypothetical protein VCHA47P369_20025 [Vibrio chagasii]|nr:hypothetical protein VCHA32O87_70197 [Vibrio chagasii]CAH7071765.1 hypothetical protein VCHA47P369_20025 [Vibrio chagasii]CAH7373500.1 hypothetical protein VCHA43P284_70025 [Vibrio chagasii]CAH7384012.1 hypothetical protein VCHA48P435_80187 [Vibrio chagasii]CAH7424733.1 hypothetical protein VCHA51O448_80186 [Vibrio chagasii]
MWVKCSNFLRSSINVSFQLRVACSLQQIESISDSNGNSNNDKSHDRTSLMLKLRRSCFERIQ